MVIQTIKYYIGILIIFLLFLVTGCSDDSLMREENSTVGEVALKINLSVSKTQDLYTRDYRNFDEMKINSLCVLIFNSENQLVNKINVDENIINSFNNSHETQFDISLNASSLSSEDIIYTIANTKFIENDNEIKDFLDGFEVGFEDSDLTALEKLTFSNPYGSENAFIMSGKSYPIDNTVNIELKRTAAKISLKNSTDNSIFELTGFSVYNVAEKCYLTAGTTNLIWTESSNLKIDATPISDETLSRIQSYECYLNPTVTFIENQKNKILPKSFIVIKGIYNNVEGYYAVSLFDNSSYYNIKPNHWYDIDIEKVLTSGYSSPEEAIKNLNSNNIWINIYDHESEILSMVSDGVRELGVLPFIEINDAENDKVIVIRCFSGLSEEMEDFIIPEITLINDLDWLEIATPSLQPKTTEDGLLFHCNVTLKPDAILYYGKEALLEVEWLGLKREIKVIYIGDTYYRNICSVELKIIDPDTENTSTIKNYWIFISGEGTLKNNTSSTSSNVQQIDHTPVLYGIKNTDLADDKIRNAGFHFPVVYGNDKKNLWTYEYKIDFSPLIEKFKKNIKNIEINTKGDSFYSIDNLIWDYVEENNEYSGILKLKNGMDSYEYALGEITFIISFNKEEEPVEIAFPLYHTGFFHYDYSYYGTKQEDTGYYYYEVIPMGNSYWLDRNLGARSNKFYSVSEESYHSDSNAKGKYFSVAYPGGPYNDPIFAGTKGSNGLALHYENMCPPGYHIPDKNEWESLMEDANFNFSWISESEDALFYNSYYSNIGKIYFPLTGYFSQKDIYLSPYYNYGYYEDNELTGNKGTGYYWSSSVPDGSVNSEGGNWLTGIQLNNSSWSLVNGNVKNDRMVIRCVADK